MTLSDFFGLFGGLALFLYGMQMMSTGLEDAAGNRMKNILEKLTSNRFLGILVGAGITAIIQSSSATTVMVVGFVSSGMMTLGQAVWIIMGANIGTTITGQLIALDIGLLAPLIAFAGVLMLVFLKKPKLHPVGKILAGLGMLFIGMDMMSAAMKPLQSSQAFIHLMTSFSNPLLAIAAGAIFTAIIQSSSASVGILQALATNGLIAFPSAVFVLFGQNIGTCITAVLASVGSNRDAKRATMIHLLFNLIGTLIFTLVCLALPLANYVASFTPGNPASQIANMHTLFNIATTLLLLPFGNLLARLAMRLLPVKSDESEQAPTLPVISEHHNALTSLGSAAIQADALRHEINRMLQLARRNAQLSFRAILENNSEILKEAAANEETLDLMNREIAQYISEILVSSTKGRDVAEIEGYFLISGNVERIGDHADNIGGYLEVIERKQIVFSPSAREEIIAMQNIVNQAMDTLLETVTKTDTWLDSVQALEEEMDDMTLVYRERHLQRMREGKCSAEACILYSEMLTDFERIGDHVLNIAEAYAQMK